MESRAMPGRIRKRELLLASSFFASSPYSHRDRPNEAATMPLALAGNRARSTVSHRVRRGGRSNDPEAPLKAL